MTRQVRQFVAFVASPGDLQQEREVVRRAAQSVNGAIGRLFDLSIVVEGWEEVQPALGRPQAVINPRVDDCDIFIGLLNRRWGTPTGTHSSGFEEEYHRALTRARAASRPEIALFFRQLSTEEMGDPGPQLQQVLTFQERVREERVALYKTFDNADDLQLKLVALLVEFLAERASASLRPPSAADSSASALGGPNPAAVAEATETDSTDDVDAARRQISDVLQSWADVVGARPSSGSFDRDRLLSFAVAMGQDSDPLPTHPANRLYRRRETLHLSGGEADSWLRALCEEAGRVPDGVWGRYVPGWFFFIDDEDLPARLLRIAKDNVWRRARGAVLLMTTLRARPAALWSSGEVSSPTAVAKTGVDGMSSNTPVADWTALLATESTGSAALQYLHDVATSDDAPLLAQIAAAAENHPWKGALTTVVASIGGDRLPALDYLLEHPFDSADWVAADVAEVLPDADTERVIAVISGRHTRDTLRVRAFDELLARGALDERNGPGVISVMFRRSDVTRDRLLDRPYDAVDESLRALLNQGWFSLSDDERRFGLEQRVHALIRSPEELSAEATEGFAGLDAWRAQSVQGGSEDLVIRAREVLRSGGIEFAEGLGVDGALRTEEIRTFAAALGRAAALRLLASAPMQTREPGDIVLVRDEVASADFVTRQPALNALAALAEPQDVPALLEAVSEAAFPDLTSKVLGRILELGGVEAARQLAHTTSGEIAAAGARALALAPTVADGELEDMLYAEDGGVRRAALEGLIARLDESRLMAILDSYPGRPGQHYYDVVTSLDWHLFGPKVALIAQAPLNES